LSIRALVAKKWPHKVVRWCADGDFLGPAFATSRVQHISDLLSKSALRPHHVWNYGRHPISDRWDRWVKKKRKKERRNHRVKI